MKITKHARKRMKERREYNPRERDEI